MELIIKVLPPITRKTCHIFGIMWYSVQIHSRN